MRESPDCIPKTLFLCTCISAGKLLRMKPGALTIIGLISLILLGWGVWEYLKNKSEFRSEQERVTVAQEQGIVIETDDARLKRSRLLSEVIMITGLGGFFLIIYELMQKNTKSRNISRKENPKTTNKL